MKAYFDHAATTPMTKEVVLAMQPFFQKKFGNASSLHQWGRESREAVENAREKILRKLEVKGYKLVFTAGGTEANNLALKGIAFAHREKGRHIITSKIEHDCVLNACKWLEKQGFSVTYLNVDKFGYISPEELKKAIRKDTILVSIIHANSEIGTLQDLNALGKVCAENKVLFHTDACQSFCKVPLDLSYVDLVTLNAHKIHGPKGVGALLLRENIKMDPLLHGGNHEFGLRSGTENVAGIAGFAQATESIKENDLRRMSQLRDRFISGLLKIENSWLNGPKGEKRLCNNVHVSFRNVEGESLILYLDAKGIAASTGSACSSRSLKPSHVLMAIGLKPEESHGSIRLTLGKDNTEEQVDYALKVIQQSVENLRRISPFK